MTLTTPKIKSLTVKLKTDRPVKKTPYQVKGVLMRDFPNDEIVPMLNGSYRKKFLYPRIQVKIVDEEILLVGLHQGVDPILAIHEKIKDLNFGDITFDVLEKSVIEKEDAFVFSSFLHKYRFLSNWVALNINTSKKYDTKNDEDKLQYLNNLIAKNIFEKNIYSKINVIDINPIKLDQNGWGAFDGEFYSNIILPSYIGIGNGVTRGYGTISGSQSNDIPEFDNKEFESLKLESESSHFSTDPGNFSSKLFEVDVSAIQKPIIRKNKKKKTHSTKKRKKSFSKAKNARSKKEKIPKQNSDEPINYNSYEYHKKQHSI